MRYQPPFGATDPNQAYQNGDPTIGRQGSIPPAASIEFPQREIINVINKSMITPSDARLDQMTLGVRSQFLNYAEDTGSLNNISVAFDPPITAYTRGLPIRVRVRFTNTDAVRINAGAGTVFVRKMNGADVRPGELIAGGVATLVYEAPHFQLTNYIGFPPSPTLPPQVEVFNVKIPYTVDISPTANTVIAPFTPQLDPLSAGDMIAVKINNTNTGPTTIIVDSQPAISLTPNGGGIMLQGDIHVGDIVIFFYDGTSFFFAPNPEISADITYTVGTGQQFTTVDDALTALKRKTIGARGYVTLRLAVDGGSLAGGAYPSITVMHPDAERIRIRGTYRPGQSAPVRANFQISGHAAAQRANDAVVNRGMLLARYGAVIRPALGANGVNNAGPGILTVEDILVVGDQQPIGANAQQGFFTGGATSMLCVNCAAWGCYNGFYTYSSGSLYLNDCFAVASTAGGIQADGASIWANNCLAAGNGNGAFTAAFGTMNLWYCHAAGNAGGAVFATGSASISFVHSASHTNALDAYAYAASAITLSNSYMGTTSPPWSTMGNHGSWIVPG